MPTESTVTLEISCDNPNCPGHPDLDPADRTGWLFVSHEVYGEPTAQHVFGSYDCLGAGAAATDSNGDPLLASKGAAEPLAPPPPPVA